MKKLFLITLAALMALVSCNKGNNAEGSLDGRWNALRSTDNPNDYAMSLIFNGNKLDIYVIAWGWHWTGTYRYSDNEIMFTVDKAYQAYTDVSFDEDGNISSYSWEAGNLDGKTLKLADGFNWYELQRTRKDLYDEYKESFSEFDFVFTSTTTAMADPMGPVFQFTKQ